MWQAPDTSVAGINPLMQTPAPVFTGSGSTSKDAAVQPNRTAQAVLRKTKISPKKLNEFARLIRRMHIDDALVQCQVAPNKAAKLCYKVIETSHAVLQMVFIVCSVFYNSTRCLNAALGYLTNRLATQCAVIPTLDAVWSLPGTNAADHAKCIQHVLCLRSVLNGSVLCAAASLSQR